MLKKITFSPFLFILFIILLSVVQLIVIYKIREDNVTVTSKNIYTINLYWKNQKKKLKVEFSKERQDLLKGLMYRKSLEGIDGMLFIFPNEQEQSFWMKNTYINLDIIFFDAQGNFLNVYQNASPCADKKTNCPLYPSFGKTKYVLETKAGLLPDEWFDNELKLDIRKI